MFKTLFTLVALFVSTNAFAACDNDCLAKRYAANPGEYGDFVARLTANEQTIAVERSLGQTPDPADIQAVQQGEAIVAKVKALQSQPSPPATNSAPPAQQQASQTAAPPAATIVPCAMYREVGNHFDGVIGAHDGVDGGHACWNPGNPLSMEIDNRSDNWYAVEIDSKPVLFWQRGASQPVLIGVDKIPAELAGILPPGTMSLIPPWTSVFLETPMSGDIKIDKYVGDPGLGTLTFTQKWADKIVVGGHYETLPLGTGMSPI